MKNGYMIVKLFLIFVTVLSIDLIIINVNKKQANNKLSEIIDENENQTNDNEIYDNYDEDNRKINNVDKLNDNQITNNFSSTKNVNDKYSNYSVINNKNNILSTDNKESETLPTDDKEIFDVYLLDLTNINIMESGDIDKNTGENIENRRRIRTINFVNSLHTEYDVKIQNGYTLTIFEYDNNYNFISATSFLNNNKIILNTKTKYLKITLNINDKDLEKSLSLGQWAARFGPNFVARISVENIENLNVLNKSISITSNKKYSSYEIQQDLLNDNKEVSNKIWDILVYNNVYTLNSSKLKLDERKTYYVSPNGNDNNSGLLASFPKKNLDDFSGISNINILLECGETYYMKKGFELGNNVTIASYGKGSRPVLSYYKELNKQFTKVNEIDNLYYTELSDLSDIYNGNKNKSDCNIGQLVIDDVINWKRKLYSSDEEFTPELLTDIKDNWSWAIDVENARLYIYTTSNPNNAKIKYAPPVTALSAKNKSNIIIQGIEITGSGLHGINFTNCKNVEINCNSFKYIGGSVLTSAGTRYGNAIQIWESADNISVTNNFANWIFDTCYTTQGGSNDTILKNVYFKNNIGMHSQWGIEIWGIDAKEISNINYTNNLLINMGDITNPTVKMQCSSSGHLYGEVDANDYITYRYGYTYHQAANLALWLANNSFIPNISDNIFWGTNRFLVIGTWNGEIIDINTLKSNLFYEEYSLSRDVTPAMYKIKTTTNKYMANISEITSNNSNIEVLHKKGTYDNTNELNKMKELVNKIISQY